ncbi:transcriptional regulator ATRX homolog isoform X5 [Drosophila bipectinata]|uniref:transcriptional regulator ATRX homolog isoform X5 n=1 Tax=Drosophila bipectinata TaxID=42026 RepID=UPI0038B2B110
MSLLPHLPLNEINSVNSASGLSENKKLSESKTKKVCNDPHQFSEGSSMCKMYALSDHNYTTQIQKLSHDNLDAIRSMLLSVVLPNRIMVKHIPTDIYNFIENTINNLIFYKLEYTSDLDDKYFFEPVDLKNVQQYDIKPKSGLVPILHDTMNFAKQLFYDSKKFLLEPDEKFKEWVTNKLKELKEISNSLKMYTSNMENSKKSKQLLRSRNRNNNKAKRKLLLDSSASSKTDFDIKSSCNEINIETSSEKSLNLKFLSENDFSKYTISQKNFSDGIDLFKYIKLDIQLKPIAPISVKSNTNTRKKSTDYETDRDIESDVVDKLRILEEWSLSTHEKAGCLLLGYEAFRTLVFYHSYKYKGCSTYSKLESIRDAVKKYLLNPGADIVICDEGHIIKNSRSAISLAVAKIKTRKRIILTGTPIQNNLKEYYSMVNFIKPLYLGTEREFANLYANPIKNGQHKDSSKKDITVMKQRSYVLHKKLSKFVQRKEAELLKTFLPEKFEYVLFIPMTAVQNTLYEYILEAISKRDDCRGKSLITDYTVLRKIWTHPKVLEDAWKNANKPKTKKDSKKVSNSDEDLPDDIYDSQSGVMSVTNDWWRRYLTKKDLNTIIPSNKLRVMFSILRMCEEKGEKCLIFSAFVAVLNVVEYFLQKMSECEADLLHLGHISSNQKNANKWINGQDYYRLDGKTPKNIRHEMIKRFNSDANKRARVFLISSRAGGQGINLIGANRVIILDTSWNPSNDQQNIFRVFRLGQKKNCYIYRLLAMGTMEEKVYSRSVTKQAMSFRVVDEQQIDRHYNMAELAELYTLSIPQSNERTMPLLPKDTVLADLLRQTDLVYKYHEHDSLLENKVEQELSEQEKADAWDTYEKELQINYVQKEHMEAEKINFSQTLPLQSYLGALKNVDMQTLVNYRIQPTSMVPLYNYNINRYMNDYNYYQNLKMNSYIKENNFDSSIYSLNSSFTTSQNIVSQMSCVEGQCDKIPENNISPYEQYRSIMETSLNQFFLNQSYISNIEQLKEENKNSFVEKSKTNLYKNFSQTFNDKRPLPTSIGYEDILHLNELSTIIKNSQDTNIHTAITPEKKNNNFLVEKNLNRLGSGNMSNMLSDGSSKTGSGDNSKNKLVTLNAYKQDHSNVNKEHKHLSIMTMDLYQTSKVKDVPSCSKSVKKPLFKTNNLSSTLETQIKENHVLTKVSENQEKVMSSLFVTNNSQKKSNMDITKDVCLKDNDDIIKEKTPPLENINIRNSAKNNDTSIRTKNVRRLTEDETHIYLKRPKF